MNAEIDELKNAQAIYIARKNDRTDAALSEYVNHYPERKKLQIMFLRESEGVY